MQEADATRDMNGLEDRQGLTSGALWDSLKSACNRMQRSDLSSMCERRDLEGEYCGLDMGTFGGISELMCELQDSEERLKREAYRGLSDFKCRIGRG
jgi:hypothetical protein